MSYDTKYLRHVGSGPQGSDCTGEIYFEIKDHCTVKELCDDVIASLPNEWGNIKVVNPNLGYKGWSGARISYSYGKYDGEMFDENTQNMIVQKVRAFGGWTRLDLLLKVEP